MNADALLTAIHCLIVWAVCMMPVAWRLDQINKH